MEEKVEIPNGIQVKYENETFSVAGKLGEVKKKLSHASVGVKLDNNNIIISSDLESRKAKRLINTFIAHINNLFKGVENGFVYKMKIIYTHFPMTVKLENNKLIIENFIGERSPRIANVLTGAQVKIDKQDITVTGIDLDAVSQTASNIERVTKIVRKDRRIFQDGIYITEKGK